MKTALTALVLALVAPIAHAWTPCDPDPATWPVLCRPAAPGHAARCMSMSPFSADIADGYDQALPYDFVYAMRHAEYTHRIARRAFSAHEKGLISYQQVVDAVWVAALNPPRPGVESGQTAIFQTFVPPLFDAYVPIEKPLYTEKRFSPLVRTGNLTVNSPRSDFLKSELWYIEVATRIRGWANPGVDGMTYSGGHSAALNQHIQEYYNGYGYAPEVMQAVYDLWLPEPTTGHCELE